jgi:hypothetical protein
MTSAKSQPNTEPIFRWVENLQYGKWELYEFPRADADGIGPIAVVSHKFIYRSSKQMTAEELQLAVIRAFVVPLPDKAFWNRPTPDDWANGIGDERYPFLPRYS